MSVTKREMVVREDGSTKDVDGTWRLKLEYYELIQHTSSYNAVYLIETGKEITFRTTWNAGLRTMRLLNDAYKLGRASVEKQTYRN